jgi:outer membrane protein assembly factor BamD
MKRFVSSLSAICLTACMATAIPAAHAGIFDKKPKSTKPSPTDPLAGSTSKQPDKELFDKAMVAMKKGKYDVARLDLQTMLNTYPESEYAMRAKLAVGDTWYKEGGSAALEQAEAEYKDFITFFPNQPEAAEAQMKVADIYFQQMSKPDRDDTNIIRAEQEYRLMIQQFPDSPMVPRAKQRLRDVQEVMADRQYQIGAFYASHNNWPATIARLQSLVDAYPLYSHSDLALIQLGDAYAAEAIMTQKMNINGASKERLASIYDDRAAHYYAEVVTRYPEAPHVEDARERLIGLARPVPEPTAAELAESEAEEQSRVNVKLKDRAMLLVKHGPSTISASRVGEPTMVDPKQVTAPEISKENVAIITAAINNKPVGDTQIGGVSSPATATSDGTAPPRTETPAVKLDDVPGGDTPGNAIGAQVLNSNDTNAVAGAPGTAPPTSSAPASPAAVPSAEARDANGNLQSVGPPNTAPLPAVEKPAEAEAQHNDAAGSPGPGTAAATTGKKNPKVKVDESKESSSKHKKKKGLDKLNPF